jgi:hypothetical protein
VPFADTSTYKVPEGLTDEQVVYLADILPTGYEVGVLNGHVQPADPGPPGGRVDGGKVPAPDSDAARRGRGEAEQQGGDGALARPAGADHGDPLPPGTG